MQKQMYTVISNSCLLLTYRQDTMEIYVPWPPLFLGKPIFIVTQQCLLREIQIGKCKYKGYFSVPKVEIGLNCVMSGFRLYTMRQVCLYENISGLVIWMCIEL